MQVYMPWFVFVLCIFFCRCCVMIVVKDLSKSYGGFKAVDGVSFSVGEGEVVAIIGPNGAGKSTTLKMVCGLLKPSGGSITVEGKSHVSGTNEIKRLIGYMPEESSLYEDMNVYDYLNFFAELYNVRKADAKERITKLLDSLDLRVDRKKVIGNMSKGMKRKVLLARSLINDPRILVYDEPASGLDPITTNFILNYILDLKRAGKIILLTAHNMHHVEMISDRIVIINSGKVLVDDSFDNIRDAYGKSYSVRYLKNGEIKSEKFGDSKALNAFVKTLVAENLEIYDIQTHQKKLEEIFVLLTKKS
jgi:ABC-2 type transport system ATP-binding protein